MALDDLLSWRQRIRSVHHLKEVFHADDGRVSVVEQAVIELSKYVGDIRDDVDQLKRQLEDLDRAVTGVVSDMETLKSAQVQIGVREVDNHGADTCH